MERCKGSMIRDPDCALVRYAVEKSMQEIKLYENYRSLFPGSGRTRLLQDMAKMHYAARVVQGGSNNISVPLAPHFLSTKLDS